MKWPFPYVLSLVAVAISLVISGYVLWKTWTASQLVLSHAPTFEQPERAPASAASAAGEEFPVLALEEIMVNVPAPGSPRVHYLRVKLDLELFSSDALPVVEQRRSGLKHALIEALAAEDYFRLSTLEGKLHLKEKLVSRMNEHLNVPAIRQVHFGSFYLQ